MQNFKWTLCKKPQLAGRFAKEPQLHPFFGETAHRGGAFDLSPAMKFARTDVGYWYNDYVYEFANETFGAISFWAYRHLMNQKRTSLLDENLDPGVKLYFSTEGWFTIGRLFEIIRSERIEMLR